MSDQPNSPNNERLARLEAMMEIFLKLLQEIRDDFKAQPTRQEFDLLKSEVSQISQKLDKNRDEVQKKLENADKRDSKINMKLAAIISGLSVVTTIVANIIAKMIQ